MNSDSQTDSILSHPCSARREVPAEVLAALAEDARCRRPGVTGGLYRLYDVGPHARYGHGVPMIRHRVDQVFYDNSELDHRNDNSATEYDPFKDHGEVNFDLATDDAQFRRRWRYCNPAIADFDLARHGLVAAGGAVSAAVCHSARSLLQTRPGLKCYDDIDLFLVGHASDDSAKAAIVALIDHVRDYTATKSCGSCCWQRPELYRTQNCITIFVRHRHAGDYLECTSDAGNSRGQYRRSLCIQVVLRHYSTAAEVVHGFDLGSSAMSWDGTRVWLTRLGMLAARRGVNVLNLAARRASYETRLCRYFSRGFDIVLPDLKTGGDAVLADGPVRPWHGLELWNHEGYWRPPVLPPFLSGHPVGQCRCAIRCEELRPLFRVLSASIAATTSSRLTLDTDLQRRLPPGVELEEANAGEFLSSIYMSTPTRYGNYEAIALANFRAASRTPVATASFVAMMKLGRESSSTPDDIEKYFTCQPTLRRFGSSQATMWDDTILENYFSGRTKVFREGPVLNPRWQTLNPCVMKMLLGLETTREIIERLLATEQFDHEAFTAVLEARFQEVNASVNLPSTTFMTVTDATAITGTAATAPHALGATHVVTAEEWYSQCYQM